MVALGILVFLIAPTVLVFGMAFNAAPDLSFPPRGFSMQWFERYLENPVWIDATLRSLVIGAASTILAVLLGTAAAVGLAQTRGAVFNVVSAIVGLPLVVPGIIIGLALFDLYSRMHIVGDVGAIILAHTMLGVPYVFVNVIASFTKFDFRLEQASLGLGAGPLRTFLHVTFPGVLPGVIAGAFFAFISSWDDLAVTMLIAGSTSRTLPVVMFSGIRFNVDPTIAAVAAILTAVVLVLAALRTILERRINHG
ncbi:ABC transporter permease [Leucobacter chromiiresistens]|uniref:ABC transporter permease n=1 Tax=Leucobacter chromiiresistens TaxID=1079994 RepID=UPI00187CD7A9|nr:ABC transporter permease [Leucobacter chromiiresistens]